MAVFEVTAPNGKTLEIEGDTPPSEQELDRIFADMPQENSNNLPSIWVNEDGSPQQPLQGSVSKKRFLPGQEFFKGLGQGISALGVGLGKKVINPLRSKIGKKPLSDEELDNFYGVLDDKPETFAGKTGKFIGEVAPAFLLPEVKAFQGANTLAKVGNTGLTGLYQGGLFGGLESLKNEGDLSGFGIGALAGGTFGAGMPAIGTGFAKMAENPTFQKSLSKTLEALTSVPEKYTQRALKAELTGNSLFTGKFDPETAYIPIEKQLRRSIDMLPTKEDYAKSFSNIAQKAKTGMDKKLLEKNVELNNVIRNMPQEASDISALRESIDTGLGKYQFGDINPALEEAGGVINKAKKQLGYQGSDDIKTALNNYVNDYNVKSGLGGTLDKEKENIAFDVLAQATGKNKNWLKSQLKAEMPKTSTQKRQEFVQNLLENTDDKIENIDPSWQEYFPELNWQNLQENVGGGETVASNMFDKIMGRNFRKQAINPTEQMILEADANYSNILSNLARNPNEQGYTEAYKALDTLTQNMDDYTKQLYAERLMNDIDNIENIVNPKVKPATLHGIKEELYDRANFGADNFGNYGNSGIKSVAADINQYLRNTNPEYGKINDELKLLNSVKYDVGGPQGLNANTLAGKLKNIGSEGNTLTNLDNRLKNIDTLVDNEYKFYNEAKNLADTQRAQDEMLKLIGGRQYQRNPRLLGNINDEARNNALNDLQRMTGSNFMDNLEDIRAREALEKLFPGQGGGSGSAQGFGNLLRTSIIGGVPTAAAITHNPVTLLGLLSTSPKFAAQGTIRNLGAIYNNLDKIPPETVIKLLFSGTGAINE